MLERFLKLLLSRLLNFSLKSDYPAPPKTLAIITGQRLKDLLATYGITLKCPLDMEYGLPTKDDWVRFLKWYKANAPVKPGDYTQYFNCDAFAWVMVAYALVWMKGVCPFGYIEAASVDDNYPYPMHGFCFMVDWNEKVYFAAHLELAAPCDEPYPAYAVYCQDAKA